MLLLPTVLLGCNQPPPSGTLVGNPGKARASLAPEANATLQAAETSLTWDWIGCGSDRATIGGGITDLIASTEVEVPAGSWCALVVTFDDTVRFEFDQVAPPGQFTVELSVTPPLTLYTEAPLIIDGDVLALEIGSPDWITVPPFDVRVQPAFGPTDVESMLLAAELAAGTALFFDDGDGLVDANERAEGPVAAVYFPPPDAFGDEEDPPRLSVDGGCQTSSPSALWLSLLAVLGLRRSARTTAAARRPRRRVPPHEGCESERVACGERRVLEAAIVR